MDNPHKTWLERVYQPATKKALRQAMFRRSTAEEVLPIYVGAGHQEFPGQFPFTRGVQATMYRGRLWTMRQYAGFASAAESNARYRYLLARGQTGLSVAFDLPTQMGLDPDHEQALGEVGRVGVSIASLEDMEVLMAQIPLADVSVSMTINATATTLLGFLYVAAERQGVDPKLLQGTVQNDILKEYMARGTYIYPPRPSMRLITDLFAWCAADVPKWNTISISGYHVREAGCDAAQELAFTLGDGIAYVEAAIAAGLSVDDFANRLAFFFNGHNNFLEEVAKFRAARRLWARIMRERFGAQRDESCKLRFHTQTGGSTLTAQQPDNNIVRVTLQALAAVLGGTQSLHTNSLDETYALPTADAAKLALRTQQIIADESGVTNVADPLGGSWYIEKLTDEIEAEAAAIIQKIDDIGGIVRAIEVGYPQREIAESAFRFQQRVESGERKIVGVNSAVEERGAPIPLLHIDAQVEAAQIARCQAVKANRDQALAQGALAGVRAACQSDANLVEAILAAVKVEVTLGEICDVFRDEFGVYRDPAFL